MPYGKKMWTNPCFPDGPANSNNQPATTMSLYTAIEDFVRDSDWDDEISIDPESGDASLATSVQIRTQSFRLFIEADEEEGSLALYLYPQFSVIAGKSVDAALLFNYLNDRFFYRGHITVMDDNRIRYKDIIDTGNITPSREMIHNMLRSGASLFRQQLEQIAAVALTKKTYEAIRSDYDRQEEIENRRESGEDGNGK